jgi:hypothetical protein
VQRLNWIALAMGVPGGGLAALVQWWPATPSCAGCGGAVCGCPLKRIAGSITVPGVFLGIALGIGLTLTLQWLSARERRRRASHGEL